MTSITQQVNVLVELEDYLGKIEEKDLEWSMRDVQKPAESETVIGTVESELARWLWAASVRLKWQASIEIVQSQGQHSPESAKEQEAVGQRYATMSDLARALFWAQVKDELVLWNSAPDADGIGVQSSWKIVTTRPMHPLFGALRSSL